MSAEPVPVGQRDKRVVAFAPGRVNLIGEHTDYNDGLALPFAVAQGVTVSAAVRALSGVSAHAIDLGERDDFDAVDVGVPPGWRAFVRGTVAELRDAGCTIPGVDLQITSTLPMGSGLSSSGAVTVAVALALMHVAGCSPPDPRILAELCSGVENRWVGVRTGLLDQLAIICAEPDAALRIDFRTLDITQVPMMLDGWSIVVVDSGERRALADSGYNTRRGECEAVLRSLGASSMRDVSSEAAARLPEPLNRRALHVIEENLRVDAAVSALQHNDMHAVGALLNESHRSLRDLYEVSTDSIDALVSRLLDGGAAGARLVGGGFGGSVIALLPPGIDPAPGALTVAPCSGARLIEVLTNL